MEDEHIAVDEIKWDKGRSMNDDDDQTIKVRESTVLNIVEPTEEYKNKEDWIAINNKRKTW